MQKIKEYFAKQKEIYQIFLEFIESGDDDELLILPNLINNLDKLKFGENIQDFKRFIRLIFKISNYHVHNNNFFDKIYKVIIHFEDLFKEIFTNFEIFKLFKSNKLLLLFLFKKKILQPSQEIVNFCQEKVASKYSKYCHFFYPEFQGFIEEPVKSQIREDLLKIDKDIFDHFDEWRQNGQNHQYLCELIRNDSVKEFVAYVTKANISLSSKIQQSMFESNTFLFMNIPSLIEYSVFFGSIQIFQYLRLNNVELSSSLWIYSIHGNNPEIIHILEEDKISSEGMEKNYEEAIKCHHNGIASYIQNNFIDLTEQAESIENNFDNNVIQYSFHYSNYSFFPDDFSPELIFPYLCKYNYFI